MRIQVLETHPVTFVTVRELADYWLVSSKQIYKYIRSGILPSIRIGARSYRISTTAAREFERRLVAGHPVGRIQAPRQMPKFSLIRGRETGSEVGGRAESAGTRDVSPCALVSPAEPREVDSRPDTKDVVTTPDGE